jgi:Fe-S-cluster-containing dehydrogenase component
MPSGAEQTSHLDLAQSVREGGTCLFIDLAACRRADCRPCTAQCGYFYHPCNNGVVSIAELATCALACATCAEFACVVACPSGALERQMEHNNLIVRHNARCSGCRTCHSACPYGERNPASVPLMVSTCEFCLDQCETQPVCSRTCDRGGLRVVSGEREPGPGEYLVGDRIVVHSSGTLAPA